jgi:hypothetical protein
MRWKGGVKSIVMGVVEEVVEGGVMGVGEVGVVEVEGGVGECESWWSLIGIVIFDDPVMVVTISAPFKKKKKKKHDLGIPLSKC